MAARSLVHAHDAIAKCKYTKEGAEELPAMVEERVTLV